jgi:hypothetical protein
MYIEKEKCHVHAEECIQSISSWFLHDVTVLL